MIYLSLPDIPKRKPARQPKPRPSAPVAVPVTLHQPAASVTTCEGRSPLERLRAKQSELLDAVGAVVRRYTTSLLIYGRPGTAKTRTVRDALTAAGTPFTLINGAMTPQAQFELFEEHPNSVIVLDDLDQHLREPRSRQFLLAALEQNGGAARRIHYRRAGQAHHVDFTGGLIMIANSNLFHAPSMAAVASRVTIHSYEPDDQELNEQLRELVKDGWRLGQRSIAANDALRVVEYVISGWRQRVLPSDLRVALEGALPRYLQWKEGHASNDWTTSVDRRLDEQARNEREARKQMSRDERSRVLQELARRIQAMPIGRVEQEKLWEQNTGMSDRQFRRYRGPTRRVPMQP